jgi:hypothetical protein
VTPNRNSIVIGALAALLLGLPGCNLVEAVFSDAQLVDMVAGQHVANGELGCWLEIEFKSLPAGVNPTDVRVRFESIALVEPADFDWHFISQHDVVSRGTGFGSGYSANERTRPGSPPPLGETVRVRFPLRAQNKIENAPRPIWLEAHLYWGDRKQSSRKRTLDHVYESKPGSFF